MNNLPHTGIWKLAVLQSDDKSSTSSISRRRTALPEAVIVPKRTRWLLGMDPSVESAPPEFALVRDHPPH